MTNNISGKEMQDYLDYVHTQNSKIWRKLERVSVKL